MQFLSIIDFLQFGLARLARFAILCRVTQEPHMRLKVEKSKQAKARGVSMSPELWAFALRKSSQADISFSKYVQRLIDIDRASNIVPPLKKFSPSSPKDNASGKARGAA